MGGGSARVACRGGRRRRVVATTMTTMMRTMRVGMGVARRRRMCALQSKPAGGERMVEMDGAAEVLGGARGMATSTMSWAATSALQACSNGVIVVVGGGGGGAVPAAAAAVAGRAASGAGPGAVAWTTRRALATCLFGVGRVEDDDGRGRRAHHIPAPLLVGLSGGGGALRWAVPGAQGTGRTGWRGFASGARPPRGDEKEQQPKGVASGPTEEDDEMSRRERVRDAMEKARESMADMQEDARERMDGLQESGKKQVGKFRQMLNQYGLVFVATYSCVYLTTLGGMYAAVSQGLDVVGALEYIGLGEYVNMEKLNPKTGNFLVAFFATKFTSPLRLVFFWGGGGVVPCIGRVCTRCA